MAELKTLKFETTINAPRETVWGLLWDDAGYREWTSVFAEGSHAETDWQEGSKVKFLAPSGDGMLSEIARKIPNEFMSFRHLTMFKDGKEMPVDAETEKWSGATENYTLEKADAGTRLRVEIEIAPDHEQYFSDSFPRALEKVKEMAERA